MYQCNQLGIEFRVELFEYGSYWMECSRNFVFLFGIKSFSPFFLWTALPE